MKPVRTLILVAGEDKARLFLNEGVGKGVTEAAVLAAGQFRDSSAEPADRQGRTGYGGAGATQTYDPHTPMEEVHRARFARHVVDAVADQMDENGADRLVLVAAPKMLGALRKALPPRLAGMVTAELGKDLVNFAAQDLPDHLSDVVVL